MNNANLNAALLRSMYALDGMNGEFLGALSTPIDRVVKPEALEHSAPGFPVTLAVIPALRIRRLRIHLRTARGQVTKTQRRFMREIEAGREDEDGYLSQEYAGLIRLLREDVAECEANLAKALAS